LPLVGYWWHGGGFNGMTLPWQNNSSVNAMAGNDSLCCLRCLCCSSIASSNLILSPEWISSMLKSRLFPNSKSSILGFASSYIFGVVGSDSRSYLASDVPLVLYRNRYCCLGWTLVDLWVNS
jgi:hypothetical protein